jgi:hypothetical protein
MFFCTLTLKRENVMHINNHVFIITLLLMYTIAYGMEKYPHNTVIYAIPGQNGSGSETEYIRKALNWNGDIVQIATPFLMEDLGQYFCQRHLNEALINEPRDVILYTTSQGTATGLNYLAHGLHSSKIKAIILEAALASGNSAIYHSVSGPLKWISNIPGFYYVAPYFVTVACLGYRPGGQQPIWSIDTIKKDIPIIIIHSKEDMQLPFYGACALYYRLRESEHQNVYFIEKDGSNHIQILDDCPVLQSVVCNILKRHLQPPPNERFYMHDKLVHYQPDTTQYKKFYTDLIIKESRIWCLERTALLTAVLYFGLKL